MNMSSRSLKQEYINHTNDNIFSQIESNLLIQRANNANVETV